MAFQAIMRFFKREKQDSKLSEELIKAEQLMKQGKPSESLEIVSKLIANKGLTEEQVIRCIILKSAILANLGKLEEALTIAENATTKATKGNLNLTTVDALIAKANVLFRMGQHEEAINTITMGEQWLAKAEKSSEEEEILEREAYLKNSKGTIYWNKGDLGKALLNFQESLAIREQLGNKQDIAATLNNLGLVYINRGDLQEANESLEKAMKISEELGLPHYKAAIMGNIGAIKQAQGKYQEATECYEQVEQLFAEMGNDFYTTEALYRMITLAVETKEKTKAKELLQKLEQLNEKSEKKNKIIDLRTRCAKAIVLKAEDRAVQRVEAQKLFQEIVDEDEIIEHEITALAMLNLCELLLFELKTYGNEEILQELEELVKRIEELAKKQKSHPLLMESYLLESKIALVELDIKKAEQLLTQAQLIAQERDMPRFAMRISKEYDELLKQMEKWDELVSKKASLEERLELANLEEKLNQMIMKRADEVDLEKEEGILMLVMSEAGLTLFSKQFVQEASINEHLIVGFLTALNAFGKEAFCMEGNIERIMHEEYTILLKPIGCLVLCYVYKGQSYFAVQKMDKLIKILEEKQDLMHRVKLSVQTGVSKLDFREIEEMVEKIF